MHATWIDHVAKAVRAQGRIVRVVVASTKGSAPREAGAAMLVGRESVSGTIGGGALEFAAIAHARGILEAVADVGPGSQRELLDYPLGPALSQCCGGYVRLLYEVFASREFKDVVRASATPHAAAGLVLRPCTSGMPLALVGHRNALGTFPPAIACVAREMLSGLRPREACLAGDRADQGPWLIEPLAVPLTPLYLYGAGHVGRALVHVLAGLSFAVTWVDTTRARFPTAIPRHARMLVADDLAAAAATAPGNACHLVMTFSHALDLSICEVLLGRGDFAFLGLIGSRTKRARFVKRLAEAGIPPGTLARLVCPIGIGGGTCKTPERIAIAVAAQLIGLGDAAQVERAGRAAQGGRDD